MTPSKPVSLLIVDDDPDVAYSFTRIFRKPSFEITEAKSGEQALAILNSVSPDVVLMDVRMPGAGGLATLDRMIRSGFHKPVILMTAFGSPRIANEAKAAGAYDCVMKPFDVTSIRELVVSAVDSTRMTETRTKAGAEAPARAGGGRGKSPMPAPGLAQAPAWDSPAIAADHAAELTPPVASEEVFDLLFNEISRRQPLDPKLDAFDVVEKHLIKRALEYCKNNQSKTARFLGITRNTLRKRIRKYGFGKDED